MVTEWPHSSARGDPLVRSLMAATLGIVAAFLISSVLSEARLRQLDGAAEELSLAIAPQVDCLSRLRGALREAQLSPSAGAGLRSELAACDVADPRVEAAIADVDAPGAVSALDAHPTAARERARRFRAADLALQRLVVAEARRAARLAPTIADQRVRAERATIAVHCLAAVVALLGLGIVWLTGRALQRAARAQAIIDERERTQAVERAEELDLFASRVAHDLKAPLGAVALYLHASKGAVISARMAAEVRQTVAGVIDIVDALLEYARACGRRLPDAEAGVREVVEQVLASLDARSRCRVTVAVSPDVVVACSRGAVRSALANLVRNALEHGIRRGGRAIEVRSTERDDRVRIEVVDDGPGVPAELRARIFEPYVRGDGRSRVGLGLGLATVRRIAEQCQGAVGLEPPAETGGACFWIELPLRRPAPALASSWADRRMCQ